MLKKKALRPYTRHNNVCRAATGLHLKTVFLRSWDAPGWWFLTSGVTKCHKTGRFGFLYTDFQVPRHIRSGPGLAYWLRRCATSRTVPESIHGGVIGDFFRGTPDRTMCPGVDSASENEYQGFLLGKGRRCFWLTTYHPCSAETSR